MGAWGTGPFANDDAADLVAEVQRAPVDAVEGLLSDALRIADESYVELPEACTAVAAAALVAMSVGSLPTDDPALREVAAKLPHLGDGMRQLAASALQRIRGGHNEWAEVWADAGALDDASEVLTRIQHHLDGPPVRRGTEPRRRGPRDFGVGTVVELRRGDGPLAYAQVLGYYEEVGHLLRVVPGVFSERPDELSTLIQAPPQFYAFSFLETAGDLVEEVDVPAEARPPVDTPVLRMVRQRGRDLNAESYELWRDGKFIGKRKRLTPEEARYSVGRTYPVPGVVETLEHGYRPEQDVGSVKVTR